jgi:hypothetical protein
MLRSGEEGKETRLMMSQREQGVEAAGEGIGRSGTAEARGQRTVGDDVRNGGQRRSFASGLYRAAVSFNGGLVHCFDDLAA